MTGDIRLMRWPRSDQDDYRRLASVLRRVRGIAAQAGGEIVATVPNGPEDLCDLERAQTLFAQRRARDRAAGDHAELFGEPVWDMLLVLFIAYERGQVLGEVEVREAIGIRRAVADRWRAVLIDRAMITRIVEQDGRAAGLVLTDAGIALVLRCIDDS